MTYLILFVVLGAFWAAFLGLGQVVDAIRSLQVPPPAPDLEARVREIEDQVDRLPSKWEAMVKEAARAEGRARALVRRTQKELEDRGLVSQGVEAEADQLRLIDGEGGDDSDLQPVRRSVAYSEQTPHAPAVDDWKARTLARKYGGAR